MAPDRTCQKVKQDLPVAPMDIVVCNTMFLIGYKKQWQPLAKYTLVNWVPPGNIQIDSSIWHP